MSYCKHGTNVGHPGGPDLMCGHCEMGFDLWVDDPRWGLFLGIGQPAERWRGTALKVTSWRESEVEDGEVRVRTAITYWQKMADEHDVTLHWVVERLDGGYWDYDGNE